MGRRLSGEVKTLPAGGSIRPGARSASSPPARSTAAVVALVTSTVALGLGAVLRSTAATLVSLGGLVLGVPMFAHALPTALHLRLASVLVPNLTPQLAGADHPYLLSPPGAGVTAVVWVVVALGAGAIALDRRDAT